MTEVQLKKLANDVDKFLKSNPRKTRIVKQKKIKTPEEKEESARYRNTMLTFWSPPKWDEADKALTYLVYQKEKAPTTGREHWQAYAQWGKKMSKKAIRAFFNIGKEGIWIGQQNGTDDECVAYVTKADTRMEPPVHYGIRKESGHRSDLDNIVDDMIQGHTMKEVLFYHKGKALRVINMISKGMEILHGMNPMDKTIITMRTDPSVAEHVSLPEADISDRIPRIRPEVNGNIDRSPLVENFYKGVDCEDDYQDVEIEDFDA